MILSRHVWAMVAAACIGLPDEARAADDNLACQIIDCLPGPDGAAIEGPCENIMATFHRLLTQGQRYPGCPTRGVSASEVGYEPYACRGRRYIARGNVAMCREPNGDNPPFDYAMTARPDPYFIDLTFPDGVVVRVWFEQR